VVLLRIEDLEQGRDGSPRKSAPTLSISSIMKTGLTVPPCASSAECAGQRSDVGAAMAANLGLVVNATQRDAHELAAQCLCDGLAQACLADAWRPNEAENGAA